ncbi:MAG: radical SAM protein [Oscillospiraceae bacterium]|nr:radical SAM protein [Oscillospiraceae bacterium]
MPIIYTPSGAAREYSPHAANLYLGCSHRCQYCYAPHALQRTPSAYFGTPAPRRNVLNLLDQDLKKQPYTKQILLSFIGDVYGDTTDNNATTRAALQLLDYYKAPVAILSKGGERILRDLDVFREFGQRMMVGSTLTFLDEAKSREWEPGAAPPEERLAVLKALRQAGIRTFASFEPTIEPTESLALIERTLQDDSVVTYKIGKLNNYKGLDKQHDWADFLQQCLALLRGTGKQIYIKSALRKAAPDITLHDDEQDAERWNVSA